MDFSINEELWFGDFTDDQAEQLAAASLAAVAAQITGLRPFPAAAQKLLTVSRDPNYKVAALCEIIEGDPSLAARVLRLVNSAAYSLRARCTSVGHAVTLLGAKAIGEVAAAIAILDMFREGSGHAAQLRVHLLAVASLARQLALLSGQPAEDVFTCGLMHDLGKLLHLQVSEEESSALFESVQPGRDTVHLAERERYGYDHAVLAGHVLAGWEIPAPVPQVVAWHHQPARAYRSGGSIATMVSLVRLADRLSYDLLSNPNPDAQLLDQFARDEAAVYLGLSRAQLADEWDRLLVLAMEARGG